MRRFLFMHVPFNHKTCASGHAEVSKHDRRIRPSIPLKKQYSHCRHCFLPDTLPRQSGAYFAQAERHSGNDGRDRYSGFAQGERYSGSVEGGRCRGFAWGGRYRVPFGNNYLGKVLLVVLSVLLLASCSEKGKPQSEPDRPQVNEIRKETRRGPFCVRLMADKDSLNIAENVRLTIEAEVEEGFEAQLPKFGDKLGEFGIRDYRDEPQRLSPDKKIISRKVYTLEPFLSGDYTIAPMQVRFRKPADIGREDENGTERSGSWQHEISTEEITIKVHSLLEKDQRERALNPIKGPVPLPSEPLLLFYILIGLGTAGLAAGGAVLLWRRRRAAARQNVAPALPAHEIAYRQLQEILDEKLIERGEIKLFFLRISDVLRGYIENRFALQAPRRTTEEFLADIAGNALFCAEHQQLLMAFLQDCDLVKFAEHTPTPGEITRAIDSCRAFIDTTAIPYQGPPRTHRM